MPVTKTAKRALRSSRRKETINKRLTTRLEIAIRQAKLQKTAQSVRLAVSLADRAAKKGIIHRRRAARIKSRLTKLPSSPKK